MPLPKWAVLVAAIFIPACLVFGQSGVLDEKLIVLASSDAPGKLNKHQVSSCFAQLAHEWKVPEQNLPKVIVFHVSRKAAESVQIKDTVAVRENQRVGEDIDYFEVWIVGVPDAPRLVLALQNVLEAHLQLQLTDEQRNAVMSRVARMQRAIVDVAEGK